MLNEFCQAEPERLARFFKRFDLKREELKAVADAVKAKDWLGACTALLAHYRQSEFAGELGIKPAKKGSAAFPAADAILKDTFSIQGVTATQPRLKNGRLDWAHRGPRDDKEWAWLLNRHSFLRTLSQAWRKTGNPKYIEGLDALLLDWLISNPMPSEQNSSAQWRVLEVGLRLISVWPSTFYGLQESEAFRPITRIRMLMSLFEHADYCRRYHANGGNHLVMEMHGLARTGLCWPEFKDAKKWLDYAFKKTWPELRNKQVYPDGVQKELTAHYHKVSLINFEPFIGLSERSGRSLPKEFKPLVERMWNYTAYSMRPDGHGPLNNDSDLGYDREIIKSAAERYKRRDWLFIATNGKKGMEPKSPTVVFPWAGQLIMRSAWKRTAHWAFFDAGPCGMGHRHFDKLHLSLSAYGRDILVDSGRYWYKPDRWRRHFIGAASHNVILINGKGQNEERSLADKPLRKNFRSHPEFDFGFGTFDRGFKDLKFKVQHQRAVLYLRGSFWLVVDRVLSEKPCEIQPLWHFHPDCKVRKKGAAVWSADARQGNVRIEPVGDVKWNVELVKGQEKPQIQGWYSLKYNFKKPAPTAVYRSRIKDEALVAWVIVPGLGVIPPGAVKRLSAPNGAVRLQIRIGTGPLREVAVNMKRDGRMNVGTGMELQGRCAVLAAHKKPLVALGRLVDEKGKVRAEHSGQDD